MRVRGVPIVVVLPVVVVVVVPVVFVGCCVLPGFCTLSCAVELPVFLCCVVWLFFVAVLAVGSVFGAGVSLFTLVVPSASVVIVVVVVVVVPVVLVVGVKVVGRFVVVWAVCGVIAVASVRFGAAP